MWFMAMSKARRKAIDAALQRLDDVLAAWQRGEFKGDDGCGDSEVPEIGNADVDENDPDSTFAFMLPGVAGEVPKVTRPRRRRTET